MLEIKVDDGTIIVPEASIHHILIPDSGKLEKKEKFECAVVLHGHDCMYSYKIKDYKKVEEWKKDILTQLNMKKKKKNKF